MLTRIAYWGCAGLLLAASWVAADELPAVGKVVRLFDGKTLEGWERTEFGGEGEVEVDNGELILGLGDDMTGVTYKRPFPKLDYEVSLEAQRVAGTDFFCGLTFPVGESPCSLICGGWGGSVVGLSSIDGNDASDNETTSLVSFEEGKWYKIRLRVTADRIDAWIDQEHVVALETRGKELSIRPEVELNKPFGIATWRTVGAIRNLELKRLK
jgi:hypothetical protein